MKAYANAPLDFQYIFNALPGFALVIAADAPHFTILAATDAYLHITGKQRSEMLGQAFLETFPHSPGDTLEKAMTGTRASLERVIALRVADTLPTQRYDLTQPAEDGDGTLERYWNLVNTPVFNENGEIAYIIHQIEDVTASVLRQKKEAEQQALANDLARETEALQTANRALRDAHRAALNLTEDAQTARRQAEQTAAALRESEQRLALALNSAAMGVWSWDLKTDAVYWSPECYDIQDLTSFDGSLEAFIRTLHPEDAERVLALVNDAIANHTPYEAEFRIIRRDGTVRWVVNRGRAEYDAAGQPLRMLGIIMDIDARKQVEEALRESEERFHTLADNISQFVWMADETGQLFWYNQRWFDYTGTTLDEMRGWGWRKVHHPDHVNRVVERIQHSWDSGEIWEDTFPLRSKEGEYRWFLSRAIPIRDGAGKILCWFGTNTDITERRNAEEQLLESERHLRSALEAVKQEQTRLQIILANLPVGVMVTDTTGAAIIMNEELSKIWRGHNSLDSFENYHQYQAWDLESGKIFAPVDWPISQAMKVGEPQEERQFGFRRFDDTTGIMCVRAVPIKDEHNKVVGGVAVAQDISDRKQAEEAIRSSEEFIRSILESSPDCIKVLNLAGQVEMINIRGQELMEIEDFALCRGQEWQKMWPAECHPLIQNALAAANRAETNRFQAFCPTMKGNTKWWDVIITPVRDAKGQVARLIATLRDITEYKALETEREYLLTQEQQARSAAEAATRAKDDFLALVSHELRNPLNAILGYARVAQTRIQDAAMVKNSLAIIERNAKMQQQLIEDLLDTARIITGKLKVEIAPTDLRTVLEETLAVVRPTAESKSIALIASLSHEPIMVNVDAARLQQAVVNLLQNAIKFTPEEGRVALRCERDDKQTRIIVSDTGRGIEAEFLPSIFDRFSQSDTSRTRRFGGLGLGLALVKQLVELHGGTISATSAGMGQGTTFTISLPPFAPQPAMRPSPRAIADVSNDEDYLLLEKLPRLDGIRVLVVDDQEEARQMVATALQKWGAEVTIAASGQEVAPLLELEKFDVLVCDIAMPEVDGYEVLRRLRTREQQRKLPPSQRLPAIALTAQSRAEDRLKALNAGFLMHVAKPVEIGELVLVIASLTSNLQAGKSLP